jgi:hypothetical protein
MANKSRSAARARRIRAEGDIHDDSGTYRLTLAELARLDALSRLGPDAVLRTVDARLYCGGVSSQTWERRRRRGQTPPAILITKRAFGYRKKALDADLDARAVAHKTTGDQDQKQIANRRSRQDGIGWEPTEADRTPTAAAGDET